MIINSYTIFTNKISRDYNLALLSDFHNTRYKTILRLMPTNLDAILMPGDFVIRYSNGAKHRVIPFLFELCNIAPVYCSLGNHDIACMNELEFINMIEQTPAKALINDNTILDDLCISGWYYKGCNNMLSNLYKDGYFNILLSHKPEWYFDYIKQYAFELVLSGHAHGGQMRLFGKPILAPGQGLFPKYVSGLHDNRLLISTGLSNPVHIPRLFNPREIVIINLKAEH